MKSLKVYKILLIFSFPIAVVLRSIFSFFLYLLALVSRSNMFISGIDGGLSLALITISFMAFCLVSIYEILKKDDIGIRKQKDGESEVQDK